MSIHDLIRGSLVLVVVLASKLGRIINVQSNVILIPMVNSFPILAVPRCDEKDRLPILTMVVSALTNTARAELVPRIMPSLGGAFL
jgi:hypothetical protein